MKKVIGTNAISGLNISMAPHLIGDSELTSSENGWTIQEGAWDTAPGPEVLYTGYSDISCFASGRMNGETHLVWMDGNTVYDNGDSVGTITAGTTMSIYAVDDGFIFIGAAKVYLYDGTVIRELGTWQGDATSAYPTATVTPATGGYTITGITKATVAVVTTSAPHGAAIGDHVWIDNCTTMPEINNKLLTISAVTTTPTDTFTVDINSLGFAAAGTDGKAHINACGISGTYKYYLVPIITLSSGRVLTGSPVSIKSKIVSLAGPFQIYDTLITYADTFELEEDMYLTMYPNLTWETALGVAYYFNSGTLGTDYIPGIRLYRTAANGSTFQIEKEWTYGTDITLVDHMMKGNSATLYWSGVIDTNLGAVYDVEIGDHGNAPVGSLVATLGQRAYLAVDNILYWSHLDGIEYWSYSRSNPFLDTITALGRIRDKIAVFSSDRIWTMDMSTAFPDIKEIDTPVGTTYPEAMFTIDDGILFLREDGLWLFDGFAVKNIGRRAIETISAPATITSAGDTIYMSGDVDSYVVRIRNGGWVWHGGDGQYQIADSTGGDIYAASGTTVSQLFSGASRGGTLVSKMFGGLDETKQYRVLLDVKGPSRPTVYINGVRQSDPGVHDEPLPVISHERRVIRYPIPRLSNPYFTLTVETTGDLTIYGFAVESE